MEEQKSKVRLGEQKPSVCRLCFSVACNFHFLNDIQQDMIEIIFPELNLGVCSNLVLCQECVDNLEELFTFKSTCLDIEESLHNYMVEGQKQIDLDKITGLKGMDAQHDNLGRFSKLCRTCLELTEPDDITELVEDDNNMVLEILATCFPEVDINLTIQAIICKKCVNLIQKYYTFFNKCMENETKIHIYLESHPTQELTLYNVLNLNYSSKQQTNNDMCKSQSPKVSENKTEKPKETLKQFSTNKSLTDLRDKDVLNNSNEKQDSEMNSNNDVQISVNDIDVNMPSDSRGSFNSLDDRDNFETENTKSDSNISSDENELLKPQKDSLSSNNQNHSVDANTERVNENDNQNIRKRTINDEENDNVHSVDGSQENTPYNTRKKKLKITTDAHDVQNDDVVNDPDFVQHKQGNSTPYNTRKKQHKKIIDDDGEQEDNVAEDPDFVVKTNEPIEDFDDVEEPENIQSKKKKLKCRWCNSQMLPSSMSRHVKVCVQKPYFVKGTNLYCLYCKFSHINATACEKHLETCIAYKNYKEIFKTNSDENIESRQNQSGITTNVGADNSGKVYCKYCGILNSSAEGVKHLESCTAFNAQQKFASKSNTVIFNMNQRTMTNLDGKVIGTENVKEQGNTNTVNPNYYPVIIPVSSGNVQQVQEIEINVGSNETEQSMKNIKLISSLTLQGASKIPYIKRQEPNMDNQCLKSQSTPLVKPSAPQQAVAGNSNSLIFSVPSNSIFYNRLTNRSMPQTAQGRSNNLVFNVPSNPKIVVHDIETISNTAANTTTQNLEKRSQTKESMIFRPTKNLTTNYMTLSEKQRPKQLLTMKPSVVIDLDLDEPTPTNTLMEKHNDNDVVVSPTGNSSNEINIKSSSNMPVNVPQTNSAVLEIQKSSENCDIVEKLINDRLSAAMENSSGTKIVDDQTVKDSNLNKVSSVNLDSPKSVNTESENPVLTQQSNIVKNDSDNEHLSSNSSVNNTANTSEPTTLQLTSTTANNLQASETQFEKKKCNILNANDMTESSVSQLTTTTVENLKALDTSGTEKKCNTVIKSDSANLIEAKSDKNLLDVHMKSEESDSKVNSSINSTPAPHKKTELSDKIKAGEKKEEEEEVITIDLCEKSDNSDNKLSETSNIPKIQCLGVFKCDNCDFNTRKKKIVESHISTHLIAFEINHKFRCIYCGSYYDSVNILSEHQQTSHQIFNYRMYYWCVLCSTLFYSYEKIEEHNCASEKRIVKMFKSNGIAFCMMCNFESEDIITARLHLKICASRSKSIDTTSEVVEID